MQYRDFVKQMFAENKGKMSAKEIMKMAAQEWPAVRDGKMPAKGKAKAKGKGITGGGETGGSILDDIGSVLGFGMEKPKAKAKRAPRKAKAKQESGAGIFGSLGSVLSGIGSVVDPIVGLASGHGLKENKAKKQRGRGITGGYITGGAMQKPKQEKKNVIPKTTNPLSTFYQFNDLPLSNYAMSAHIPQVPHGGMIMLDKHQNVQGGGILDNIMPLLPFALL